MRDFEKISYDQFKKDIIDDKKLYEEYKVPSRGSNHACGYDIFLLEDLTIKPGEIKKIPTGIKAKFGNNEALLLIVRSHTGFKYNIRLCNQVGVIDSDYYNNADNEGHIWIKLQNEGEKEAKFEKGQSLVQAMFINYLITDSDINQGKERKSDY